MRTQNTPTGAENTTAARIVRLPRLFIEDHIDRGLDTPKILRRTDVAFYMDADDPHMRELLSDAEHYASDTMCGRGGWDAYVMRYARSAKRLLASYKRQIEDRFLTNAEIAEREDAQ